MTAELARRYRIGAIEAIGTDPRYPVTEGWPLLVAQLIAALERDWRGEPVYGVGTSPYRISAPVTKSGTLRPLRLAMRAR